jgi:hypothetical protein
LSLTGSRPDYLLRAGSLLHASRQETARSTGSMNLCGVFALALAGWYLMVPPPNRQPSAKGDEFETAAPLTEWNIYSSYVFANACAAAQMHAFRDAANTPLLARQLMLSQCVRTDDPRLKRK